MARSDRLIIPPQEEDASPQGKDAENLMYLISDNLHKTWDLLERAITTFEKKGRSPQSPLPGPLPGGGVPREGPEDMAALAGRLLSLCCLVITGRGRAGGGAAIGIIYNGEAMFGPVILFIERSPALILRLAEKHKVPVVEHSLMAGDIAARCKAGEAVPERYHREIAAMLARAGSAAAEDTLRPSPEPAGPRPTFIALEMGKGLYRFLRERKGRDSYLAKALARIRGKLHHLLYLTIPEITLRSRAKLEDDEYRIVLKGMEAGRGHLDINWYPGLEAKNLAPGRVNPGTPLFLDSGERLEAAVESGARIITRALEETVLDRAPELLGRDEVQAILDAAEEQYPAAAAEVRSSISPGALREIFRALTAERVSLRSIGLILETIADWNNFPHSSCEMMVEYVRHALRRQICLQYAGPGQTLRVLTLDAALEERFADPVIESEADADRWEAQIESFAPALEDMELRGLPPVILCSPGARPWVKELTFKRFPRLAALSFMEIPPGFNVEPLGELKAL